MSPKRKKSFKGTPSVMKKVQTARRIVKAAAGGPASLVTKKRVAAAKRIIKAGTSGAALRAAPKRKKK